MGETHMIVGKFDNKDASKAPARPPLAARLALPCLLLALSACATSPDGATNAPPYEPSASMGMLIARDSCAECHQTGRTGESPNEDATPFREIASRPGMTQEALAAWLIDGHNYPAEMGFELEPHQVESLAAHMIRQQAGG